MKKYRVVLVGIGSSIDNHTRAVQALQDRVDVVAVVDRKRRQAEAYCAKHDIPNAYTDVAAMLATEKPDLVCVVTPPATHKSISIQCLEAGAWVYCEKPFVASLDDFDTITEAENRTGNYVSTVFQWRFGSAVAHLKKLMADGVFGKPLTAICHTLWYRTQDYYAVEWRGRYETEFGGPTMTLGIHLTDLLLDLMGDWQDVRALIGTLDRAIEIEDTSMALVRFQNGLMASIVNTVLAPRQTTSLRLDFQHATIELDALYHYDNAHWKITPASGHEDRIQAAWDALDVDYPGAHAAQLRQIIDCMDAGVRPPVSGADARRIIEFTASLYKSAHTGHVVSKGQLTPDDAFYYGNDGIGAPS